MLYILKGLGFLAFIPATMLLTVSYFVLFSARLVEKQGLKLFAYCVAALLWISALLIFVTGISLSRPIMPGGMMQGKCPGMMMRMGENEEMEHGMMQGKYPGMMMRMEENEEMEHGKPMNKGCMKKLEERK